ncbi:hypothetical protein INS49_008494 [Diaporthe citri]|uniref:uncharacterized protein n=1 Tax=Diaporthe citri TaxID=83186 RepID=UPI001C81ED74|nr:uncharacterized protein INS49_008494 [Diaporthe citri]KAG6363395.1 hypothetical protein INS49_008494 [Diaporthe citri]
MDDQEKQVQQEQKKFGDRLREVASISKIRERLRRRQYRVKQGSPPPKPPPYCPHWHKARPKPQKAWTKVGTERLRGYEDGFVSRLERYEERLQDPTSKEARQKAARGAGYSSTATTLCGAPVNPEAELVDMFERLRELERLYELSDDDDDDEEEEEEEEEECAGARQEQSEEDREEYSSTEAWISGARSLGTGSLKGKNSKKFVQRGFHGTPQSLAFGWA